MPGSRTSRSTRSKGSCVQAVEALLARLGPVGLEAVVGEQLDQGARDVGVVVDDQKARHAGCPSGDDRAARGRGVKPWAQAAPGAPARFGQSISIDTRTVLGLDAHAVGSAEGHHWRPFAPPRGTRNAIIARA